MLQDGLVLLAWGFCLKLVIADNVASIVNKVFMVEDPGFAVLWIGTLGFGAQIYADFYGYTCIARGSANLFGFELVHNFHHPYLAQTPADFWRRWNVSVSQWFRDYVYIPLGGNRRMPLRASANVMATFGLSGLWHGASWNFVLWGLYHGALLLLFRGLGRAAPRLLQSPRLAIPRFLLTWTLVQGSWLLFREHDMAQLWTYLTLSPSAMTGDQWHAAGLFLGLLLVYTAPLMIHSLLYVAGVERWLVTGRRGVLARGALVAALVFAILAFRSPASNEFIYFRF
jgi:D-alanyl-lipoteichoic acid acyltransferase DltB (MBOAT superfamily)